MNTGANFDDPILVNPLIKPAKGNSGAITVRTHGVPGWPRVIEVEGDVKCLVCDGLSKDSAVCIECQSAVKLLRSVDNLITLKKLIGMEHLDVLIHVMEGLTKDAIAEYLARGLRTSDD